MSSWWCEHAWVEGAAVPGVRIEEAGGRLTHVRPAPAEAPDEVLRGLVLPGFANGHSHAFHRALRGRTHGGGGTFWTWRTAMYDVADRLDPDTYLALATATYAEMALAGVTAVGEFHYLHHGAGGVPYDDPNAMGEALRAAARAAGIRLTLLDTCYLQAEVGGAPLSGPQLRFGDRDVEAWAGRVAELAPDSSTRIGVAAHSVRAVPRHALGVVAGFEGVRHVHLSEQPAENAACLAVHGCTPTELLADEGFLGPRTTAVHATHLAAGDISALGATGTCVCLCPTTERDLADGLGHAIALRAAGSPLSVGSDQQAVIDLLEEARGVELHARLASGLRGQLGPAALVQALTQHASLGWEDAGELRVGARADLVAVRLDSVRTAGCRPDQAVFAATATDVTDVVVDGRAVVRAGQHLLLGDVPRLLEDALGGLP